MLEQWTKWEPIQGLAPRYYVDSIVDGLEGFKMTLSDADDSKKKAIVFCNSAIFSYRSTYETFRAKLISDLGKKYGTDFYGWAFFKVTNSSYIQWLSQESDTISDFYGLIHYSFITMDFIIDIVNSSEPTIQLIDHQLD